jgi:hypothetical protein
LFSHASTTLTEVAWSNAAQDKTSAKCLAMFLRRAWNNATTDEELKRVMCTTSPYHHRSYWQHKRPPEPDVYSTVPMQPRPTRSPGYVQRPVRPKQSTPSSVVTSPEQLRVTPYIRETDRSKSCRKLESCSMVRTGNDPSIYLSGRIS